MNGLKTLTALLSATVVLAAPSAAAAADSDVASGTVRDAGGGLAQSGTVELFADPSGSGASSGSLTPVARGTIHDGRFSVAAPSAALARNAADVDGYRDWLVAVRTPQGTAGSVFSSRAGAPAQLTLRTAAVPAALARDAVAESAGASKPCHYKLEKQVNRRVRMSDVHGWIGVSSTYQYAAEHSADTAIGVAIQSPKGIWSASGTDHVSKAKVFGQTAKLNGRGERQVTGVFKFNILKAIGRDCPKDIIKRFTRAYRFEGGMRLEKSTVRPADPGLSGKCNTVPGAQKLYPATTVFTATANSFTYERGVTLFTLSLTSSTSFSKNAQITLDNHGQRVVWVCGANTAGQPVPISQAAMLYAGPRIPKGK